MAHAILSASGAHRWLSCTRSARFEQDFPEETSPFAEEGTRAHALAERTLKAFLKGAAPTVSAEDAEMREAVQRYVDIAVEKIGEARAASPDAAIFVEKRLDFSDYVPQGFGTGDLVMVSDARFEIVDLKYGKGVPVSAVDNPQLRLYALGMAADFVWLYGASEVTMTIVQPRLDSVSSETLPIAALYAWGEKVRERASLAFRGLGEFCAGEHCRFCRARKVCRARAEYMLEAAKEDFPPEELKEEEISKILSRSRLIKSWLEDVESYALGKALAGKAWPGLKLVAGRSVRRITNEGMAAVRLEDNGFKDIYKPRALRPIGELEKLCGKKEFAFLMAGLVEKPEGKPCLVPKSDKRPALDFKNDFKGE